jgi:hypothetical protein
MTAKPLFKPTQIPGCQLWLDAADTSTSSMVLTSGNVTTWKDKSGNGNATTTSVGPVPLVTNGINGLAAVQTSPGRYFYMDPLTNPANTTTVTAFAVSSLFNGVGAFGRLLSFGKLSDGTNNFDFSTVPNFIFCRDNLNEALSIYRNNSFITTSITYTVPFLMEAVFDGTNCTGFLNGTQFNTFASSGTFSFNRFGIGVNIDTKTNPADVYSGNIGEILVFYSALTTSQRQQVEGYLAWKWGLVVNLPADHPYKTTPVISSFPFPSVISPSILTVAIPNAATNRAVFTPRQISGCQLWLDGVDPNGTGVLPITGSTVSIWNDKSGNARNVTGSGTPTFLSGGGINFNGTNAFYTNTNFAYNLSTRSVFLVAKVNTYKQYAGLITFIPNPTSDVDQNSITGMSVETAANTSLSFNQYLGGPAPVYMSILTASLTNVNLYNDNMNGTIGTGFVNGNTITNITTATIAGTTSGFGVGTRWQGSMSLSYLFTGAIYEIILYSGPLSTTQRQQVEGYLAWKWGLISSLPNGHPYKQPPIAPFPYAVRRAVQGSSGVS